MSAQGAVSEARDLRTAGSSRDSLAAAGSLSLPDSIVERLRAEGINSLADWVALGRRRLAIFGVTRRMVTELDALAREVQP